MRPKLGVTVGSAGSKFMAYRAPEIVLWFHAQRGKHNVSEIVLVHLFQQNSFGQNGYRMIQACVRFMVLKIGCSLAWSNLVAIYYWRSTTQVL